MTADSALERLAGVFRKVFGDPGLSISAETSPKDLLRWDSLFHVVLLVAIEKEFGIRFSTGEIHRLKSVGALLEAIEGHR
jgi:acyl carrier protein